MKPAVIYARVSSKEQEREGFSIPARLKLLRDYAIRNDFSVVKEFVDIETAKTSGRLNSIKWCSFSRKIAAAASYWSKKPTACTVIFATPLLWKIWTWRFTW